MSIRDLLNFAAASEEKDTALSGFEKKLLHIIKRYDADVALNPGLKSDVFSILSSAIELAEAMLDDTYPADLILREFLTLMSSGRNVLEHSENTRPGTDVYSILRVDSGTLLPQTFKSPAEAQAMLASMADLKLNVAGLKVVEARLNSREYLQPRLTIRDIEPSMRIAHSTTPRERSAKETSQSQLTELLAERPVHCNTEKPLTPPPPLVNVVIPPTNKPDN